MGANEQSEPPGVIKITHNFFICSTKKLEDINLNFINSRKLERLHTEDIKRLEQ